MAGLNDGGRTSGNFQGLIHKLNSGTNKKKVTKNKKLSFPKSPETCSKLSRDLTTLAVLEMEKTARFVAKENHRRGSVNQRRPLYCSPKEGTGAADFKEDNSTQHLDKSQLKIEANDRTEMKSNSIENKDFSLNVSLKVASSSSSGKGVSSEKAWKLLKSLSETITEEKQLRKVHGSLEKEMLKPDFSSKSWQQMKMDVLKTAISGYGQIISEQKSSLKGFGCSVDLKLFRSYD